MITINTKYALKIMIHLAKNSPASRTEIAERESIPIDSVVSIFEILDRFGFIEQTSQGRVGLARPPHKIMVGQVVRAIDGPLAPIPCVSQTAYQSCSDCLSEKGCEVRRLMKLVRDTSAYILDNTSLLDMGAGRNARIVYDEMKMEITHFPR